MTRTATRIARGAMSEKSASTNVALVRGRLVAAPSIRLLTRRERVASFDIACVIHGRKAVTPISAAAADVPTMRVGDEVTVLGHVRRRFFRIGARTQTVTEIVAEHVAVGGRAAKLDKLLAALSGRGREATSTVLPKVD